MSSKEKTIIYIPTIYQGDSDRAVVPEQYQYRWFKCLWEVFVSYDINVIWKAGRFSHLEDPVQYWKAPNIRYSTASLEKELKHADLAVTDTYSATCVLDCAKANVPIMVLIIFKKAHIALNMDDVSHSYIGEKKDFKSLTDWLLAWGWDNVFLKSQNKRLKINKVDWISILKGDKI